MGSSEKVFCRESGHQWPDLDDASAFESWPFGTHCARRRVAPHNSPKNKKWKALPSGLYSWLQKFSFFYFSKCVWIFLEFFEPPRGRERAQNVPPGTGFRTPKYRQNPASGGPIGGKNTV